MRFHLTLLLTGLMLGAPTPTNACTCGLAQRTTYQVTSTDWTAESLATVRTGVRKLEVRDARLYRIDAATLRTAVFAAPHERNLPAEQSPVILELPLPTGPAAFRVVSYDISAPGETNYPEIRTGYGVNVNNPLQTIFFDWTELGFHASIRGGGTETVFIDPLFSDGKDLYQVYRKSDFDPKAILPSTCEVAGEKSLIVVGKAPEGKSIGGCELRQYRTAITATGEYSNFHGATSAAQSGLVESAIVTTVNRVNQVFTRDISLRLQLVANNDQLYNYDPDTDPFPDNSVGGLINANTTYIDGRIGNDAYDYGHIFTRGANNGVASLSASCVNSRKAAGATSRQDPVGDPFDIDYVAHEMGHNFGGRHTQNNNCNYSSSSGMEPGSASSVMGYAGICAPNVQTNSDDYFHGRSIQEITTHIELGRGGCGTIINTSLSNPTVTQRLPDETIPAGTPFVLRSGATGDGNLTYNWEQYDSERGEVMPPVEDNTQGPLFRSFEPKTSPERYFPRLSATLGGTDPMWEELPMVSREMNFRATVINQNAAYGCATEDDVRIDVDASGRPFTVNDPVGTTQWSAGQIAQVQWDVAATDAAPFNSQLVDVLLSTDGGTSFQPAATNLPNNGLAEITVPGTTSDNVRVMVRSKDNVFFNVSTRSSRIVTAAGAPTVTSELTGERTVTDCFAGGASAATFGLRTDSEGGATAFITWSVTGLPAGATANFSVNPTRPGASLMVTLSDLDNAPLGENTYTITGTSTEGTVSEQVTVNKIPTGGGPAPTLLGPIAAVADVRPTFAAIPAEGQVTYHLQVSQQADFATLVYDLPGLSDPTFRPDDYLAGNTRYYWRVRTESLSGCGTSDWTEDNFRTGNCEVYTSTQAPAAIDPSLSFQEVDMLVSVPVTGEVLDVDVFNLDITHTYISDLRIRLIGPDGAQFSTLADRPCGDQDDILASFDDEAAAAALPCPATEGGFYQVDSRPLSNFDGREAGGDWTLRVQDIFSGDGGSLNSVSLKICQDISLPVDLLSFSAQARKDHVELIWATENEVDNLGFYIERQVTGEASWQDLGFVAAGTDYTFADRTALVGVDYLYRLRQTDIDGRVSYSPIEAARLGEAAGAMIVYPNPTAGLVNYRFRTAPTAKRYTLTDLAGKRVGGGRLLTGGGIVDLRGLPGGVYLLRVGDFVERVVRL